MGKLDKLEQLQKLKENGTLTEVEFNKEKEKLLNNQSSNGNKTKTITIIVLVVILIACIGGGIYFITKNNNTTETSAKTTSDDTEKGFEQTSANIQANGTQKLSFRNMSEDDENLTDIQKDIVSYFDNDYFYFDVENSQKYPQVFKNAKITDTIAVVKILKSTDEDYEILVNQAIGDAWLNEYKGETIENIPETKLYIIKGSQLEQRLVKDDMVNIYGRYEKTQTIDIDGKSYTLPIINVIDVVRPEINPSTIEQHSVCRHSLNRVKNVAEYIFGKDIKISQPVQDEDFGAGEYFNDLEFYQRFYLVTLDNQSNANFKVFDFFIEDKGFIMYNQKHNAISKDTEKKLFISADFQHYIVTTYDGNLRHVYIDYFNKDLKKEWSREFNYNSTKTFSSPMDYTEDKMAIVVDNDLYLIDLKTGENIIEPVIVGEKIEVNMMSDGIVLVGDDNKDTIMKVDYDGKILFRQNANTGIPDFNAMTQIVDGKMVVALKGYVEKEEGISSSFKAFCKYIVLNSDGTIETSTTDLETNLQ